MILRNRCYIHLDKNYFDLIVESNLDLTIKSK